MNARVWEGIENGAAFLDARAQAPSCDYAGGRFVVRDEGVFFEAHDKDGEPQPPLWICSRIDVLAKTRNGGSEEWGRLLEWHDDDGMAHRWAMPMSLLQGDGLEVRRELARRGLRISPSRKARDLLQAYLQVWPTEAMARCVECIGWHGSVYLLPQEAIGQTEEIVVYQSEHAIAPGFATRGDVESWREHVGKLLSGNSRLVFAAACALAGSLLDIVGEEGGGFHLRGASSTGKSTALRAAASIWGGRDYVRNWRATANGLEGVAAAHNDGVLILDEIGQCDPKQAGETAYLLANGQGKTRANRTGAARPVARWRLLFLSSGEESLPALAARAGYRTTAGQEVRLADIEADAGCGMGLFENLHGYSSPAAFAQAIKDATDRHHGAIGRAWLERIVANREQWADTLRSIVDKFATMGGEGATGQVVRVAKRFGLVAAAGELATRYGLTGWQEGESFAAAKACFLSWLEGFGGGKVLHEERAILAQVQAFIEAHGDARFQRLDGDDNRIVRDRVGFVRQREGATEYLILPEAFRREVCKGFDSKEAVRVLREVGWLVPGGDNRPTRSERIGGYGTVRVFLLRPSFLSGDTGDIGDSLINQWVTVSPLQKRTGDTGDKYAGLSPLSPLSSDGGDRKNFNKNNDLTTVTTVTSEKTIPRIEVELRL
ncbi:MAG: DUF927 domain-containing protein [Gammaproteobacteria bacterium]|nr:DUF927 domain-containing protein [Gammaproteobacteria bacterium]